MIANLNCCFTAPGDLYDDLYDVANKRRNDQG